MRRYGIKITLPTGDPMALPHLIGPDWSAQRWYDSEAERDQAFELMQQEHLFSRRGDRPSQQLERISAEE